MVSSTFWNKYKNIELAGNAVSINLQLEKLHSLRLTVNLYLSEFTLQTNKAFGGLMWRLSISYNSTPHCKDTTHQKALFLSIQQCKPISLYQYQILGKKDLII